MTAPPITILMTLFASEDGLMQGDSGYGDRVAVCSTPNQESAYAALVNVDNGVRVTIEPADAPAPGSPLDYLHELKGALLSLTDTHDTQTDNERHRALRRCLSLANSAHLAILAERARR